MVFLERLLLLIVAIVTLIIGGVILLNLPQFTLIRPPSSPPALSDTFTQEGQSQSIFHTVISKLPLLPSLGSERSLVAIVIENHEDARSHQEGLKDAYLVQEYMVEGLISRFVAFFDAQSLPPLVGPVRSLRTYFIDGILPLTNVILHAGGSPEALERASGDSNIISVNALYYDEKEFFRIDTIPAPHDLFTGRKFIGELLPDEIVPTQWPIFEIGKLRNASGAKLIDVSFYNPDHNVTFEYKTRKSRYERTNGGVVSEAEPLNILILEVPIDGEKEYGRLDITMRGEGSALLFHSGKFSEGRWRKEEPEDQFILTDQEGELMKFARGQIWMMVMPSLMRVSWE